jgi:hypothetical protein
MERENFTAQIPPAPLLVYHVIRVTCYLRFPGLENYNATNKGNKSSGILEVRLYSITLAYFLKNFAWHIVIIV